MVSTLLITGAGLVLAGLLVKKFPDLIAGYNTMSAKEKAKVDIDGLSSMMRIRLVIMGVLVALISPLMTLLNLQQYVAGALISVVLIGVFAMVLAAPKYYGKGVVRDKQKKSKIVYIAIGFAAFAILLFGFLYYGASAPEIKVSKQQIYVSGIYSVTAEVESLELVEVLPKILKRTNGFSYGSTFKGNFKLENYDKAKLYLESLTGPYILVKTKDGNSIFINTKTESETVSLLEELNSAFPE
jgi:Domain of unknown function (DUF3784)